MMKRTLVLLSLSLVACGDDGNMDPDPPPPPPPGDTTVRLNDNITANTTFTADKKYVIPRLKQLFVEPGATLTIQPGTVVQGEEGSVLVITRGAKIMAEGTAAKPIVFTTAQPDGAKTRGFWGGLLILGAAPINVNTLSTPASTEATFEAFTSAIPEGKFGGTKADDNSGVLKYVRVEFAGFNFVADREFNNLTLCGVGSGTTLDYIQVHGGSDDGIEFFGGTANIKHLVSSQNGDDGFDTDNGWNGKAQFVVIQNITPDGAREASNGYESDNHGTPASYEAAPRTLPTIYNATIIGNPAYTGGTSFAGVFRRGTGGHYANHIFYGFPIGPEFRDAATQAQLDAGELSFKSSILFNNGPSNTNLPPPQANGDISEATYYDGTIRMEDPGLSATGVQSKTAPDFKPAVSSSVFSGFATPTDPFFDAAPFVGAMGMEDWTAGWTAYPQPTN
ncbi:MAG: hypothetical protein R3B48_21145 [Kofleriaceae bacterium]